MKKLILLFSLVCGTAFGAMSDIVPAARLYPWQGNVGVRGGIPTARTTFTTLPISSTAAQINTAITNASAAYVAGGRTTLQIVKIDPGTCTFGSTITVKEGVILQGNSITGTVLKGSVGFTGAQLVTINNGFDDQMTGTPKDLVNPQKGDTTLTTSTAHGLSVGDLVLVDMLKQPGGNPPISNLGNIGTFATWLGRESGNRCAGQLVEVTAVNSSTNVSISQPLCYSYNNTPQLVKATGITRKAGIEDLMIDNLDSGGTTNGKDTVGLFGAVDCWMKNVKIYGNWRRAVWDYASLYFTFTGCIIEGGVPIGADFDPQYTSDRAYGIFFGPWTSGALVEHNAFSKLTNAIAYEGAVSNIAVGYNYFTNAWWQTLSDKPYRFSIISHGASPMFVVMEGNWASTRFRFDNSWGTGTFYLVTRNRIQATDRGAIQAQRYTFDVEAGQWNHSVVGNIIGGGTGGVTEGRYQYTGENRPYEASTSAIRTLGYWSAAVSDSTNFDVGVVNSMLWWRNWCYRMSNAFAGSGVVNETQNVVNTNYFVVPNSMYYASRPSWATKWWPVYDPDVPTSDGADNLPAYFTYNGGSYPDYTPTAASASSAGPTSVNVSWADNSTGETGFVIERCTDAVSFLPVATVGAGVTSYADTGLSPSTTYFYRVSAYQGVTTRTSPASSTVNATTTAAGVSPKGMQGRAQLKGNASVK